MKGGATNTISVNKVKICCWVEREDAALFSNGEHKQHIKFRLLFLKKMYN